MPNHFTTVGLCARDFSRLGDDDERDIDFGKLTEANLCELICKLPDELTGIVATMPNNTRYRHKTTGKFWTEDCNGPMGPDREQWESVLVTDAEARKLVEKYGASNWYDWQRRYWGTKWGTYGTKVHQLGGDGSPILIEFQSAWGPPSSSMMRKIDDYLCREYFLHSIRWIGYNPGCGETCKIEVDRQ